MTSILLYIMLWIWDTRTFDMVGKSNQDKSNAESAYLEGDYRQAAGLYYKITYSSIFSDPATRLYLAHSYYRLDSLQLAKEQYTLLLRVPDPKVSSMAHTQLAVLACQDRDTTEALTFLKSALRIYPDNETARFDYELLKRTFSGKVPANQPPEAPNQAPPSPQQSNPIEQREIQIAREREELLERLRRLNMSEDQARSILEAMKSNEAQYTYQLRRGQYYDQSERSKIVEW